MKLRANKTRGKAMGNTHIRLGMVGGGKEALIGAVHRIAARPDGIEAVAIVTPNHLHFAACKAFLAAGIHVICDKPVTSTLENAIAFAALYSDFADVLQNRPPPHAPLPGIKEGVDGLKFVGAAVRSSHENGAWVPL